MTKLEYSRGANTRPKIILISNVYQSPSTTNGYDKRMFRVAIWVMLC